MTTSPTPTARAIAMDLLVLIDELDGTLLQGMVKDTDAHVRARAWQYAISWINDDLQSWKELMQKGIADEDERVRVAAVRTISRLRSNRWRSRSNRSFFRRH